MTAKPQQNDVLDTRIALPEDQSHLCATEDDDKGYTQGYIRFLLNADVVELMREITDDLEFSRGLPVDPRGINVSDPVIVWLIQKTAEDNEYTPLSASEARGIAIGWYAQQKRQASADALFIALTMYNTLNIAPVPYKENEMAFDYGRGTESDTNEDTRERRALPSWVRNAGKIQIPPPERNILTNVYERRLKQLFDMTKYCGREFLFVFLAQFEEGVAHALRRAQLTDADGFQSSSTGGSVSKKSKSARPTKGTQSGDDDNN